MNNGIITTLIVGTVFVLEFILNPIQAQNSYKAAADTGISRVLGYEPEEFIRDQPHTTSNGIINTNFMYGNGQHAYFDANNLYFIGVKTSIDMKFEPFSDDEKNTILAINSYGIVIDTTNTNIVDLEENVLANYTDYTSLAYEMEILTNEIVDIDIDVSVTNIFDKKENKKIFT